LFFPNGEFKVVVTNIYFASKTNAIKLLKVLPISILSSNFENHLINAKNEHFWFMGSQTVFKAISQN
jgi:hypothetical protein